MKKLYEIYNEIVKQDSSNKLEIIRDTISITSYLQILFFEKGTTINNKLYTVDNKLYFVPLIRCDKNSLSKSIGLGRYTFDVYENGHKTEERKQTAYLFKEFNANSLESETRILADFSIIDKYNYSRKYDIKNKQKSTNKYQQSGIVKQNGKLVDAVFRGYYVGAKHLVVIANNKNLLDSISNKQFVLFQKLVS